MTTRIKPVSAKEPSTTRERHPAVVERHLERYPWSRLSDAPPADPSQLELKTLLHDAGEEGKAFLVSGEAAGRLPGPFEADLYIALFQLYNQQIPRDRRGPVARVTTTYAELAQLMGRDRGGTTYKAIRAGLERLSTVAIRALQTWRTGETAAIEKKFNILAGVTYEYGRPKPDARPADGGELPVKRLTITFHEEIALSLAEGNLRVLDTSIYFALQTPTAKRLFRYLDQRRWFGTQQQSTLLISFDELVTRLPIERSSPSLVCRTLDPAHEGLIAIGYCTNAEYEQREIPGRKRREWWVRYTFGRGPAATVALAQEWASASALGAAPDSVQAGHTALGEEVAVRAGDSHRGDYLRDMVAEIIGTLRDEHSLGFYVKVVKAMPEEALRNVLGGVRQAMREGMSLEVARKTFTTSIRARAKAMKIAL